MENYETSDGPDFASPEQERQVRRLELKARADAVFGANYDENKIAKVFDLQETLHSDHDKIVADFEAGNIDSDQYMEKVEALTEASLMKCSKILDPDVFEKLFGFASNETKDIVKDLIDPEIFRRTHNR